MHKIIHTIIFQLILCTTLTAATFYVSPEGDNSNNGRTESNSFKVVQYAIDQMKAGDTLVVLDGFYTGTIKLKSGITIQAKHPRKAIFSGAESLSGTFQKHKENIYKTKIDSEIKQLFYKNEPMIWACFPNVTWAENWEADKKWASSSKGSGPGVLKSEAFKEIKNLDLAGAYCFIRYSKGNSCYSRLIKAFDGTTLQWDDTDFYSTQFSGEDGMRGSPAAIKKGKSKPEVNARYFLAGALDLLDAEGEWFVKDKTLYVYSTDGKQPKASDFLCKTTDFSINQDEAVSDVSIDGIDFFATSVDMGNAANNTTKFHNAQFNYIGTELLYIDNPYAKKIEKPIHIEGSTILIDSCLFAGAHNSALTITGSDVLVQNCVFAENNRHANFGSRALVVRAKGTFEITHNTFFNNCSDAILINWDSDYVETTNPKVSFNNIFNAGLYNSEVSGVYMPNLSQHWTDFHHNWVHNVKGNGVRLDQAGEKLTVHHNVFWASKRGLNIEGFQNFNIYNNTSVLNEEACFITRNVVSKRKGTGDAIVSNDTTFAPIVDWNVLNNLVTEFVDRVGPSEKGPFDKASKNGYLHPERAKNAVIPITDRGSIQGNMTHFSQDIFTDGSLDGLNLIPIDEIVKGGVEQTTKLKEQGVTALDSFTGAYGYKEAGWGVGSNWMPYGFDALKSMAASEKFAKKFHHVSIVPEISSSDLPRGVLHE